MIIKARDKVLDDLLLKLHCYSKGLFFEIGGGPISDTELIITEHGNKDFFDLAIDLIKDASKLSAWKMIALKPPIADHFRTDWEGNCLNTESM